MAEERCDPSLGRVDCRVDAEFEAPGADAVAAGRSAVVDAAPPLDED